MGGRHQELVSRRLERQDGKSEEWSILATQEGRSVSLLTHVVLEQMFFTLTPFSPPKEPCQARSPGLFYC